MNNLFQENKRSLFLLLGLMFVLLIMVYFLFFRPLVENRELAMAEVEELSSNVESLQLQVDSMEIDGPAVETDIDRKRLEKLIPAEPELREFLLTLQEIELVSGIKIVDYSFTYDGDVPDRQLQNNKTIDENLEAETFEEIEGTEDGNTVLELPSIPENVRLITVTMELFAPDYSHLQDFLRGIEKQDRIMMISYLQFINPGELELLESEDESITVNIGITTFHYEY